MSSTGLGYPSASQPIPAHSSAHPTSYDVFLSYSHEADKAFAPELQRRLEQFAKPWRQKRALRVFRDNASLSTDPRLWSSIERALAGSSWFVLLASPLSAGSPWVEREVRWWLAYRSADRILLVVTDGTLAWDSGRGDFDREESSALPRALTGVLEEEPRWVDGVVSATHPLDAVVADIASTVRGVPKDELFGDHLREHRRAMRRAVGAITALALLLVVVLILSVVAVVARNNAVEQTTIANARQLAAAANDQANLRLDVAQLLAVRGFRLDPNPQTRAALVRAVTASPALMRFLPFRLRSPSSRAATTGRPPSSVWRTDG